MKFADLPFYILVEEEYSLLAGIQDLLEDGAFNVRDLTLHWVRYFNGLRASEDVVAQFPKADDRKFLCYDFV